MSLEVFKGEEHVGQKVHVGNITTSNKKETLLYFEADAWFILGHLFKSSR